MKYLMVSLLLIASCAQGIDVADWDTPLISRLDNTKWKISQDGKQNRIEFQNAKLKLGVGSILATAFTEYQVISEDTNFVLLSIYNDISPRLLGLKLIDGKTMRVSLWGTDTPMSSQIAQQKLEENGQIFKLQ
ncbi:MAG: hypothetical protein ACRCTJ_07300 [Brevinema sp.]